MENGAIGKHGLSSEKDLCIPVAFMLSAISEEEEEKVKLRAGKTWSELTALGVTPALDFTFSPHTAR